MHASTEKEPKLIVVPTPIGNLGDITLRAMKAIESADVIYSEDTRVTQRLISALGIDANARIYRLDENIMADHAQDVVDLVSGGHHVVYCTDAGMPGVSDPGAKLISLFRKRDLPVEVLPGASAGIVAYVSSGAQNPHFYFGGFLPRKGSQQKTELERLRALDAALVFYESPNRLAKSLRVLAEVFPDREVAVCRELTKMHEEVVRGNSRELSIRFAEKDEAGQIKGECVIVVDGPSEAEVAADSLSAEQAAREEAERLVSGNATSKDVIKTLVADFGISKNAAYEIYLEEKGRADA